MKKIGIWTILVLSFICANVKAAEETFRSPLGIRFTVWGGGWMSLSSGDYDGRLLAADAHLEYWPFKSAGLGAGFRYITIDIDFDDGQKEEKYKIDIPGPVFYVVFGF